MVQERAPDCIGHRPRAPLPAHQSGAYTTAPFASTNQQAVRPHSASEALSISNSRRCSGMELNTLALFFRCYTAI
jgi:hypothetical protein